SELTDALATSARAMPRLRSGPHHLHRKDVPHLSESLLIGIERWRFVEGSVNEFARLMNRCFVFDRKRLSARRRRNFCSCFVPRGGRAAVFCQRAVHDVAPAGGERKRGRYAPGGGVGPRAAAPPGRARTPVRAHT